jgi:phage shock protein PspC (stress-responsive transcriptional regulator)
MKKRLCKSTKNKKIAGVCAGIAEYLGVDVTVVRLIVAVGTLFWGTGLWIYLICALVLPNDVDEITDARSDYEKAKMEENKTDKNASE